ncbi:hypothetical protein Rxyl_1934 [Rubrobacter xylanophilus DSM 9941]|uniref:Right handed beta helix domain-containing protein n=1 Tax=Rubrobacter xylanophilus (strain DSM 9941 / JCM 11954 / NBRC 16129 / PRD-1) TaxID=266117 RepID=Q1AUP7_RUBXD|nr:right-handed parallel beta-helix repeat-containing protein [Rubrobacter xylanophilus]ABG04881.1 hypothetical protein Rxyl_1934 [Rubrobacter xylanophilus DSM 9941]
MKSKTLAAALSIVAAALLLAACSGEPDVCTLYASPEGSEGASGSIEDPFPSVQRLADSLSPGQTGCLLEGTYISDGEIILSRGGREDARLTLRSAPGARAEIRGRLWIRRSADYVTVQDLDLVGSAPPRNPGDESSSVTVNARGVRLINNNITNHNSTICISLGNPRWGLASNTLIKHNRIHHCGKLPPTNHHHGIYIGYATHTKVIANLIYKNADRGIQLYPNAQNSTIQGNIIDANGEGILFSGLREHSSSGNLLENNIISNSRVRWNVAANWRRAQAPGTDNLLSRNCLWASNEDPAYNGNGGVKFPTTGFNVKDNVVAPPEYRDPELGDYRINGEGCKAVIGDLIPEKLLRPENGR